MLRNGELSDLVVRTTTWEVNKAYGVAVAYLAEIICKLVSTISSLSLGLAQLTLLVHIRALGQK